MSDERTALERVPAAPVHQVGLPVEAVLARVQKVQEIQRHVMKPGRHYGLIPGTGDKPTLLKPGAELLCMTFQLAPEYVTQTEVLDPERIHYTICCRLVTPAGEVVATGLGSCTSWEAKYRYRKGGAPCPSCGQGLRKSKKQPEWYCWAKKGGCGATFPLDKIEDAGRVENTDPHDQANTILKMACKRALVAATLNAFAASDAFTQDAEDLPRAPAPPPAPAEPSAEEAERLFAEIQEMLPSCSPSEAEKAEIEIKAGLSALGVVALHRRLGQHLEREAAR